ncbi:hypothetical protein V8F20_009210 [Naviculisporaceae sp. PSN 640]
MFPHIESFAGALSEKTVYRILVSWVIKPLLELLIGMLVPRLARFAGLDETQIEVVLSWLYALLDVYFRVLILCYITLPTAPRWPGWAWLAQRRGRGSMETSIRSEGTAEYNQVTTGLDRKAL